MFKTGINKPIICKKCKHRVGYIKMKPAMYQLLEKKKRTETFTWIFLIALSTQILSDIIIDIVKSIL